MTPWTAPCQATLSITNSQSLFKFMSIESMMIIQTSHSLSSFSSCLQSFLASGSFLMSHFFASGGQSIGSFSFSISPSNEYSGLIAFRIDWFDLLAVQGTLKSLQHHSSKASILQDCFLSFLIVQLSHPYITTGKPIALTRWTFVRKVMCLLFNMLGLICLGLQWLFIREMQI